MNLLNLDSPHDAVRTHLNNVKYKMLKNPKRKGMPSHSLAHTHSKTVHPMKVSSCSFQSSRLLSIVEVSCQLSVPHCCRGKNADICRNELCRTPHRKQSRGEYIAIVKTVSC